MTDAFKPHPYEAKHIAAFQALAQGNANEHQQMLALEWVIEAAGTYDMSFRSGVDGDRQTTFAEGKRSLGLQVVKLLKLNASAFTKQ